MQLHEDTFYLTKSGKAKVIKKHRGGTFFKCKKCHTEVQYFLFDIFDDEDALQRYDKHYNIRFHCQTDNCLLKVMCMERNAEQLTLSDDMFNVCVVVMSAIQQIYSDVYFTE